MHFDRDPHVGPGESLADMTYEQLVIELARLEARLIPPPEAVASRTHLHLVTDDVVALHERHAQLHAELELRHGAWFTDA